MKEKSIYLHFFIGDCDWFVAEYDGGDLFFGYTILNGDHQCAEWSYISFQELKSIRVRWLEIDCELEEYWEIKKASEIPKIKHGG